MVKLGISVPSFYFITFAFKLEKWFCYYRSNSTRERVMMEGLIPIMCAAGLSLLYSGQITSLNQLQIAQERAFPAEVPNNGFLLEARPEQWEIGIRVENEESSATGGGLLWMKQTGPLRWHKGQTVTVRISACHDDGMYSSLQNWNAFAPAMR